MTERSRLSGYDVGLPVVSEEQVIAMSKQPSEVQAYPFYVACEARSVDDRIAVRNKYTGEAFATVPRAGAVEVEEAIASADRAFAVLRNLADYERAGILRRIAERLQAESDSFAVALAMEVGKPISAARAEVTRAVDTFTVASEEATRIGGETLPLEISERGAGYEAIIKRFPIGPCAFITPFNFPLNLAAHKIAPALAVGCPFVMKPAMNTPVSSMMLGAILASLDLPEGTFSILPVGHEEAEPLITDDRIRKLSFTGSPPVGWSMKSRAGRKRVTLELGGNAACIVDEGADVGTVVDRIVLGAFGQAGQSCISVQRVLVHESVIDELRARLVDRTQALQVGDPLDEGTFVGPLISTDDVQRVHEWVNEAMEQGATALCGGSPVNERCYPPTILEGAPHDAKANCEEVFGPVLTLQAFADFESALAVADDSRFGLQAGVFTNDLHRVHRAFERLEVGGVIINDIPSMRVDNMPYGGVKESGFGREGVRFAIEEMTERRLLVLNWNVPG